jgi:coenzyme F420 hydrogenase subunit beta
MTGEHRDVCGVIAAAGMCSGCGVCAGICPGHNLSMAFNRYGEYAPVKGPRECPLQCDLCLRACPFWNQTDNEDTLARLAFAAQPGIQHRPETGYYLESFVGYSNVNGQRANGASGGLATWFLETLLAEGLVDGVACVTAQTRSDNDAEPLFRFAVLRRAEDIRAAARSCYYPVEISQVIHEILTTPGRYAVIGLPCVLKALRLAMRANTRLRERIVIMAGLVCGGAQSALFADYICALGGGDPASLTSVTFRLKDPTRPANDHGVHFTCRAGSVAEQTVFWFDGIGDIWSRACFKVDACHYCDDVFAEVADIAFMDAWLPEFMQDPGGTSMVITRTPHISRIFRQGQDDASLRIKPIDITAVTLAQRDIAPVLPAKRNDLAARIMNSAGDRQYVPVKRNWAIAPTRFDRTAVALSDWRQRVGRDVWLHRRGRSPISTFHRQVWIADCCYHIGQAARWLSAKIVKTPRKIRYMLNRS